MQRDKGPWVVEVDWFRVFFIALPFATLGLGLLLCLLRRLQQ